MSDRMRAAAVADLVDSPRLARAGGPTGAGGAEMLAGGTDTLDSPPTAPNEAATLKSKPSGHSTSLLRSVLSNWAGYFVIAATGFVMPRLIDDRIGASALGLWDFAWSLAAYTTLLGMGVTSAVSRYVARHRSTEDHDGLSRMVSAAAAMLSASFVAACVLIGILAWLTPSLLRVEQAENARSAQWLVIILGLNGAIQLPMSLFDGILTGCERFDLKNVIRSGWQLAGCAAMVAVVLSGGGLIGLALAALASEVAADASNWLVCRRLCPEAKIAWRYVDRDGLKDVLAFGGKTVLQSAARTATYQTNGIVVSYFLGPVALAIYSRQRALLMFIMTLMNQYGNVFTPAASAADARGDRNAMERLMIGAGRYGFFIAAPMAVGLAIGGGALVRLWMGESYEAPLVMALLAIGHLPSFAHRGTFRILTGMDRHGRAALAEMIAAVSSVILGVLFVGVFGWGLAGAALAVGVAVAVGGGLVPAAQACAALGVPLARYVREVVLPPFVAVIPLAVCLWVARLTWRDAPWTQLLVGSAAGGAILLPIYWRYVLPERAKQSLGRRVARLIRGRTEGSPRGATG